MESVLIAYNNAPNTELHTFFESCADDAKQFCFDYKHTYTPVCPPNLTEQNVVVQMDKHTICFVASHGDIDGVTMRILMQLFRLEQRITIFQARHYIQFHVSVQKISCRY